MDSDKELTRLPMQWSADRNAGFTGPSTEPWIPVGVNASQVNVQVQQTTMLYSMMYLFIDAAMLNFLIM